MSQNRSISQRSTGISIGRVAPVAIAQTHNMESIASIRRGALSWEISYKKNDTFNPESRKILCWQVFLCICLLYDTWVVPLLLSLSQIDDEISQQTWMTTIAMLFEIFFIFDIYIQMHTGIYIYGDLVRNTTYTRRKYIFSWNFPLDLIALIPLPFFITSTTILPGLLLVNKLIRVRRIQFYILAFDKALARYFIFCKIVKLFLVTYFSCHFIACCYISFGLPHHGASDPLDGWKLKIHSHDSHHSISLTGYFAALFWSLGLVTKCFEGEIPRNLLQTFFMLIVMLGGFILFVYICGTLFMISKCDENSLEHFEAKLNQFRYILSFHQIPNEIQTKAIEYLENGFKSGDANDRNTMKLLCPSIAKDVKFTLLKTMVSNVPFFKCCHAAFIRALVDLMETQTLPTNYVVCKKDEQGEEMYFVQVGVLALVLDHIKIHELRKGAFFGEFSLFSNQVRATTVTTTTFCILHKLSRSHVRRVLRAYPQFESQILLCVNSLLNEMEKKQNKLTKQNKSFRVEAKLLRTKSKNGDKSWSSKRNLLQPATVVKLSDKNPSIENILTAKDMSDTSFFSLDYFSKLFLLSKAIPHKSRRRLIWIISVMLTTFYNVLSIPILNVFDLVGYPTICLVLNTLSDIILFLDIYFQFNLSFNQEAEEIHDTLKCAKHYLTTSFRFDLFCIFPFWFFFPSYHIQLRCTRILRLYLIPSEIEELSHFFRINSRHRIFFLGIGLFLCYHIAGCLAHAFTYVLGYGEAEFGWLPPKSMELKRIFNETTGEEIGYLYLENQFIPLHDPFVNEIILLQYLRALQYGTVCLSNLGRVLEPESLLEFVLAFPLMLSGLMLISIIIDEVQKRITASAVEQMEFLSTRSRIMYFLRKQKAPFLLHGRVSSFLEFWWSAHRGANINKLLKELPKSIKFEIMENICKTILQCINQMDGIESVYHEISKKFVDHLMIQLYGQNEVIFYKGDYADALYILVVGDVALVTSSRASKVVPRYIKLGEMFGCASLNIENVTYTDTAVVRTACVVAMIDRDILMELNQSFEAFNNQLLRREQKMLAEHRAMTRLLDQKELQSLYANQDDRALDPNSNRFIIWDTMICINMVIQVIAIPFYMSFGSQGNGFDAFNYLNFALELFFFIDIYFKSKRGYFSYGNKVMDISKIRKNYFFSFSFLVDFLSILPFHIVYLFSINWSGLWMSNKLLRVFKLSSQIEQLEKRYFTMNIHIRLFKIVFFTYLLAHFIGCTWYNFGSNITTVFGFSYKKQFGVHTWLPDKTMDYENNSTTTLFKYTRVLYWGLGLLIGFCKGGYPTTPLEYIFTTFIQTLGVFLLAYIVGNLLDIAQVMEGSHRSFYSNLNYVRKLINYFKFSEDMKLKIQHYYFYRLFHSIHEEHVLTKCLPSSLVADIRLFLLEPMLKKVPFFKDETANSHVIRSIVTHMSQVLVTRHDVVFQQNEPGNDMYFVFTGCLDVLVRHDIPSSPLKETRKYGFKVNEIHSGSFFGEISLFSDQLRTATIVAKTFCTLYRLSRTHVHSVFTQHPAWRSKVIHMAKALYMHQAKLQKEKIEKENEQSEHHVSRTSRRSHQEDGPSKQSVVRFIPTLKHQVSSFTELPLIKKEKKWFKWKKQLYNIEIQSKFYRQHHYLLIICLLYIAMSIPYLITFGQNNLAIVMSIIVTIFDIFSDIIFAYDIWFKMHIIETITSEEFYERRRIYSSKNLFLDAIAILPIDYLLSSFIQPAALLRFNRFLKLRQLNHTIKEIHRFSMKYELNRLKLLALYYFIICYWTACGYFGLTFIIGFSTMWNSSLPIQYFNSTNQKGIYNFAFSWHQFLRCFYYSLNLYTGVGMVYEPTRGLQYAFNFIMSVFGIFVMGYVIGEGSTLCIYLIQNEVEFKIHQMNIMEFITRKQLDIVFNSRVHNYLAYWWSFQAGVRYQTIMDQLPPRIRAYAFVEIGRISISRFALHYIRPLVQNSTTTVDSVVLSIARRLVYEGYPAGESVIVQGNIGHTMYFISNGTLMTASTIPKFEPSRFEDGQYFGDEGFLAGSFCSYSVITLRACDLLALSAIDFLSALGDHQRTAECCVIAREIATNHKSSTSQLYDTDPSRGVGNIVCDIVDTKSSSLQCLRTVTREVAELMFAQFLRLFVQQSALEYTHSEANEMETCQHCEANDAELYCRFCVQGLCKPCSTSIHEGTHFSFHLSEITTRKTIDPPLEALRPQLKEQRRSSLSVVVGSLLRRHWHPHQHLAKNSSNTVLDSSSSFLRPVRQNSSNLQFFVPGRRKSLSSPSIPVSRSPSRVFPQGDVNLRSHSGSRNDDVRSSDNLHDINRSQQVTQPKRPSKILVPPTSPDTPRLRRRPTLDKLNIVPEVVPSHLTISNSVEATSSREEIIPQGKEIKSNKRPTFHGSTALNIQENKRHSMTRQQTITSQNTIKSQSNTPPNHTGKNKNTTKRSSFVHSNTFEQGESQPDKNK